MIHDPNDPMCKCEKCMTNKAGCTSDSPDCGDSMCKMCAKKSDDLWSGSAFAKKDYSAKQRETMASRGLAMPDGSFPIANAKDLHNAIQSIGRASHPDAAKAHIKARARALHLEDLLPESWNN